MMSAPSPSSSPSSLLSPCPVCPARVASDLLLQHLASHSKEEVVAALLHRSTRPGAEEDSRSGIPLTQPGPPQPPTSAAITMDNAGIHFLAASSMGFPPTASSFPSSLAMNTNRMQQQHLGKVLNRPEPYPFTLLPSSMSQLGGPASNASGSSAGSSIINPIFMPQMMGMMQVMSSPCLIPQANGPPLLVNMPSYVYPNMMLNPAGMLGGSAASGIGGPNLMGLTPQQQPQVLLPTQPVPVSSAAAPPGEIPTMTQEPRVCGQGRKQVRRQHASLLGSVEDSSSLQQQQLVVVEDDAAEVATKRERASLGQTTKSEEVSSKECKTVDSSATKDLGSRSPTASPVPGPSRSISRPTASTGVQPHQRSAGPLKLKIKSRVSTPHDSLLSKVEAVSSATSTVASSSKCSFNKAESVFGFTQYAEDSPYPAASLNFSSMLLDPPPPIQQTSSTPESPAAPAAADKTLELLSVDSDEDNSNSNVCTVQTVTDLQNALKSEEDIQIVVPNELLETSEFKTFISTLNSFPLHESTATGNADCVAPPNSPNPTRPSSANNNPTMSPQPCSSREISRGGFEDSSPAILPNMLPADSEDDDDITLQDLVAMETMEDADACEDDQFFTLSSSTNPLEPFMNAILQQATAPESSGVFSCEKCGLHFGTMPEFRSHRDACCVSGRSKGLRRKSSKRSKAKNGSSFSRPPPPMEENANSGDWTSAAVKTETSGTIIVIKPEIKSETMDSTCQAALAATGQNWKCNQCKVVFETGPQLLEHLDLMRSSDHKCSSCHIIFDDRKTLLIHRRKLHPSLPRIKLEPSNTVTREEEDDEDTVPMLQQQEHQHLPNENGEYVCEKCDRVFRERDLLLKHMTCHDEERPFECLECGKKFTKGSLLRDHRRRHFEVGSFECGYCQKRFYTPNKLREHVRVHTGEAPLSCNICGKTFRRHSNLSEHKRTHLDNRPTKPPKELFCHCGKVFRTQRDLDWHKEGEHDKQPKKCNYCGEVFIHGSSLTRHVRLKHEVNFLPENKKSSLYAACPVCQQMFYKTSINKHIRIKHQGQKPYSCDVCKASFVTKCNLLNHQWQHKGVRARPFKCQLCKKAYLRQSLLDAHMRSHRNIKPFVCNECGLQFANKSNWQRHVAEHAGARNYECPHCQKRFSRGYYLTDHLKVHTGEKPYVCGICGKMAATRSNYNSHLRTHITREPVNSEV